MSQSHRLNNVRIAKNTVFLYFRTLFIIGIGLYTSRAILQTLGVEDFGIYNVVGGIVLMFSFINTGMVASTQRFLSYALGQNEQKYLEKVFSTAVSVHFFMALIILFIAETIGLWFLNVYMNISAERLYAANWVYQCSVISFVLRVLSVPYNASIVAHEHMKAFSYISMLDYSLRLLAVILLPLFPFDKLIVYSVSILVVSFIDRLVNTLYCNTYFIECRWRFQRNCKLFTEMFSFASWSFIGNLGFSIKDQGINILINLFFGSVVNAARGIAYQVSSVASGFMGNFQMAINPQITKRYALGEVDSMLRLVFASSKYSFFLLMIIVIPLYIRAPYVLELWLGNVPAYTVDFLRLVLIMLLVDSMAGPLVTAVQATGRVRKFQMVIAMIMLGNFPISYLFLKMGAEVYCVMYVAIATSVIGLIARLFLLNALIPFDLWGFIRGVIFRNCIVCCLSMSLPLLVSLWLSDDFWGLVGLCVQSTVYSVIIIYVFGLKYSERSFILARIKGWIKRRG